MNLPQLIGDSNGALACDLLGIKIRNQNSLAVAKYDFVEQIYDWSLVLSFCNIKVLDHFSSQTVENLTPKI